MIRIILLLALFAVEASAQESTEAENGIDYFDVWEYRVGGNSVLPNRAIEKAVYGFLGPGKTIDDVEKARAALEAAYRGQGYSTALVSIPEQSVDSGIVRLTVTEGHIGRVRVTNARYFSGRQIRAQADSVKVGQPILFPELQEDLSEINRVSSDRSVTPILKAGRDPGEVDLELRVEDELPVHGSLEVNDRFTADTAELRVTGSLSYDNLFQRFHTLSLQYTTAPEEPKNTQVWALSYLWRFEDSPAVLAFYAIDTDSDVAAIGNINVLGAGRIYGARYVRPLESYSDTFFHNLSMGVDYKDITETVETAETPISYTNLSGNYTFGWNFPNYLSSYFATVNVGSTALGNDTQEFGDKRFKAQPNYFYVNLGMEQLVNTVGGIGLFLRVNGQATSQPLINNEQFTAGGAMSVRGYLEAERLGDFGAFTNVEVRSPNVGPWLWNGLQSLSLHAFYDYASLGLNDALPGQDPSVDIDSYGFGFRLVATSGLVLSLDWAEPLKDSTNTLAGDTRTHFIFRWNF